MAQFTYDMAAEAIDAGVPDGMTDRSGGTITAAVVSDVDSPSGKAISLSDLGNTFNKYLTWDAFGTSADVEILALVKAYVEDVGDEQGIHLYLRADTTLDDCYVLRAEDDLNGFRMFYSTTGSEYNGINFGAGLTWTEGAVVAVRFQIIGSTLKSRIWEPANLSNPTADEPGTWDATETESTITAANYIGVGGRQVLDTQYLLYLSATNSPSTESAPGPVTEAIDPTITLTSIHGSGALDSVHEATGYDSGTDELTVEGTAADTGGSGLDVIEVRVDGGSWQTATGTSTWSIDLDVSTFPTGSFLIEAQATDGSGNTSTIASETVWHSPDGVWGFGGAGSHAIPVEVEGYTP